MALAGLALLSTGQAVADNGPHGGYTALTDACAGCHRAHTAAAGKLLLMAMPDLCYNCHGSTATGADTNVVDGIYATRDAVTESPLEGFADRGLKGGGFENALVDTNYDGTALSAPTTSSHQTDGSTVQLWGNGAINSGAGPAISLSCASCHDPHGKASTVHTATYRLLRATPLSSGAGLGINVADEASKVYSVSDPDNQYYGQGYGIRFSQLTRWCAQCHTRYMTGGSSGSVSSGDSIFTYRHTSSSTSSSLGCLTCHMAHGSPAVMGQNSGSVAWPNGANLPSGNERSSLLRLDNRGVCTGCHAVGSP